ncbi:DUF1015 family protein [Actinocrispum sp. NPDC049592]|uniref:DUF1015 family protein n=1 Tax=Actinocrispum sp. NPDC049592 TaxID=3154835 RepID=UPI003431CF2F
MTGFVHPIARGWVVRDAVPGPNVDEFGEPDQVRAALARPGAADGTLLAVQHPHRTPTALAEGLDLLSALPIAHAALARLRAEHYRRVDDVIALSWGDGPDGEAIGIICIVDPTAVLPNGLTFVRHTEDVYPEVVAERAAVIKGLGCATSSAMLIPADGGRRFSELVARTIGEMGDPDVSTVDVKGRRERLWLLGPGERQDEIIATAQRESLLVADGNHRVAAATLAGKGSLLALVTGGPDLRIGPINRVLVHTGLTIDDLAVRWTATGLHVQPAEDRTPETGVVVVVAGSTALKVTLPGDELDHQAVERLMVAQALDIEPAKVLRPLYEGQTPRPDADAVVLIAPVRRQDMLAIHAAGHRMPRKATYFTPKPRSGLLLADIGWSRSVDSPRWGSWGGTVS